MQRISQPLVFVAVALLYFLGGRIGLALPYVGTTVSLIWPPAGIAFAAVWVFGRPAVMGTMAGAFLVNFSVTGSFGFSLPVAVGNVLPAVVSCRILRNLGITALFRGPPEFCRFLGVAVLFAPLLSALFGTASLWINGMQPSVDLATAGLAWWAGDALAVMVIGPALLTLYEQRFRAPSKPDLPELALLGLSCLIFIRCLLLPLSTLGATSVSFAALPLIVWTALRFPLAVVALMLPAFSIVAVWATAHALGPFSRLPFHEAFAQLHLFLAAIASVGLALSVSIQAFRRSLKEATATAEQLAVTLKSIGDGLVATDSEGRLTLMNPAAEKLTGWRREEALHRPISEIIQLVDAGSGKPAVSPITQALATGTVQRLINHTLLVARNGTRRQISDSAAPVRDEQGRLDGAVMVFRDVSAEYRLRERLRESEARTRVIVETAGDLLALLTPDGALIEANPAALAMMAIPAFAAEGYQLPDAPWWNQDSTQQTQIRNALAQARRGETASFESTHRNDLASPRTLDFRLTPIPDEQGGILYLLLHGRDISARKKAEARIAGQARILAQVSSEIRLEETLTELARFVESLEPAVRCTILLVDAKAGVLRHCAGPSMPESYNRSVDGLPLREGMGSCGTAAARGAPVVVTDATTDPLWEKCRGLAVDYGIRACWSLPVTSAAGDLLGTFALYCSTPRGPTPEETDLLRFAASLAALVIERHRDAQRLRDSEEQFRATFEEAAVGVAHLGLDGRWLRVNRKLCEILGYPAEKLLNRSLQAFSHPGDLHRDREGSRKILAGEKSTASIEKCFLRENGEPCWTHLTLSLIRQPSGEPRHFIAVVEDISEKKRVLDQIQQSRDRLAQQQVSLLSLTDNELFFHQEPARALALLAEIAARTLAVRRVNAWRITENGKALRCLAEFDAEMGPVNVGMELAAERYPVYFDMVSRLSTVVADDVRSHPACAELLDSYYGPADIGATLDVPVRLFGRFCGILCFEQQGSRHHWTEEDRFFALSLANLVSLIYEHSERCRIEEALRASELSLRETLHNAPNVAVQWYGADGRVVYWNPASQNLYGWSSEETVGKAVDKFMHDGEQATAFQESIATILRTGRPIGPVEYLTRHRNGSPRVVLSTLFAIPGSADDEPYIACMDVDVTAHKRSEVALRHRDRILDMVVFTTERLLSATDWADEIHPLLSHLGLAVDVDRVCLFENREDEGEIWSQRRFHWAEPGFPESKGNSALTKLPLREAGLGRWIETLGRGNVIAGKLREFPEEERQLLAAGHMLSLAIAPVFCRQRWWGFIAFSDSRSERQWSPVELDALKAVANNLGTAIGRQQAEASLRLAATAFETSEGIMITDTKGTILRVNQALSALTGYAAEELVGKTPALLQSGRHDPRFYREALQGLQAQGHWEGEIWNRMKTGDDAPRWISVKPVTADSGGITHYVATFLDISERKRAEQEIIQLAYYDPLTGLPNRRLLGDRLQHAVANTRRDRSHGALMFVDLDHFKHLNDALGHEFGDLLLKQVAERMRGLVRENDTIGRLGGDEFVVLLESLSDQAETAANESRRVAEKIVAALDRPFVLNEHEHHVSGSVGVVLFPENGVSAEDILKRADTAMYRAKAGGRNTVRFFEPSMQAAAEKRLSLEKALRAAIVNREFEIHLQPQMRISGEIHSAEALLRWTRSATETLAPAEFIAVAEESGLIVPLGEWVLESACEIIRTQAEADCPTGISVNISRREFQRHDFVRRIRNILEGTAADPSLLTLELTEEAVIEDIGETAAKMAQLNSLGVRFAIDDFGIGRSSLAYLRQLPISEIKIDRSFIADVIQDPNDAAIVDAILAMADRLGLRVVAEGVESEEQAQFLAKHGCGLVQGYLYSAPLPVADYLAFLRSHSGGAPRET